MQDMTNENLKILITENMRLKAWQQDAVNVLQPVRKDVGMVVGEQIEDLIARAQGYKFNPADYHYERLPGEQ